MRSTSLLLAASVLCAAAPSAAAPAERIALVVLPSGAADQAMARDARRQMLAAFADDRSTLLVDPLRAVIGSGEAPDTAQAMERGLEELGQRRYRQAAATLQRAASQIRAALAQAPKAALSDASLHLAAAQLGAGRRPLALRTLRELLIWRPQHDLALRAAEPPGWRVLCDQAREHVATLPSGSIQISSVPTRAEVFVDGRRLGPTPVLATNLVLGTHYVTLQLEGYHRLVVPMVVQTEVRTVSVALKADPKSTALATAIANLPAAVGQARLAGAWELGELMGVKRSLIVIVATAGSQLRLTAYLYDLQTQRLVTSAAVTTSSPPQVTEVASLALWRPATTRTTTKPDRLRPRVSRPWYTKWWVWTIAGAVVATSIGLPVGLTRRSSSKDERFQVQW
jgi:hypothetical protein